ncbi:MAG: ABC transporter ATP-binding protein [Chloroflexota bacterium]
MELPLKRYWALWVQYLKPLKGKVVLLALLIFITIGLQVANPQIIRYFIDTAIDQGDNQALFYAALVFLGASLVLQVLMVVTTYVSEDVGWRSANQLRADLARHCLKLDMRFHNDRTPGEMIERIDGDIAEIAIFFSHFVIRIVGNLMLLISIFVVLLWEDWRISLSLAAYTVIALVAIGYLRQIAVPHWKASREASANLFGFIEEQLAGTEDIRSSGAVSFVMRNLFKFNRVRFDKELRGASMSVLLILLWIGLYTLGTIVALVSGYLLFQQGLITIGSIYLIIHYTDSIFRPLREITNEIQNLQKAAAGIERVETLYTTKTNIAGGAEDLLPSGPLAVTFDDVTFAYKDDEPVLRNISFNLEPGQVLGLLGRTGSGKTTITRLLFRLYDPDSGQVRLGNGFQPDIRDTELNSLRQHIGIVTQDVQLFRATVRDNLTFFNRSISDAQILDVINELELSDWYKALPYGLDTKLESEGGSLSAGEAQLLAFTRIFLHDPGLVILDEASSRLDPATEQLIERAVDKLLTNRTGIIVAHRLSTVKRADKIMIIEGGDIREFGEYDQLATNRKSKFYGLLQTGLEEVLA